MKKITNQEVYDALTDCIEERWKLHANHRYGFDCNAPSCALCHLFYGAIGSLGCRGCPVYLMNCGKGCGLGSAYMQWMRNISQKNAKHMLAELESAKAHFFGDWKP